MMNLSLLCMQTRKMMALLGQYDVSPIQQSLENRPTLENKLAPPFFK